MQIDNGMEAGLANRMSDLGRAMRDLAQELIVIAANRETNEPEIRSAFSFGNERGGSPNDGSLQPTETGVRREVRPPMPDPRLIRKVIRQRQQRAKYFDADLFADPAWDMLLDLAAAREEHIRVSVTSLCIASGVPPTTALRWIGQMTESGLLNRTEDSIDKRRAFVTLTDEGADLIAKYFADKLISGVSVI